MKAILFLILILTSALAAAAQTSDIVKSFEQNKTKYTREHFAEGEDASSGFDYLYYKSGPKIVKIRSIWSASHTKEVRVEDSYFNGGSLVLLQRMTGTSKQLKALVKGRDLPLERQEELNFADSKLMTWTENDKTVAGSDPRWAEMEKATNDNARAMIESYAEMKAEKR